MKILVVEDTPRHLDEAVNFLTSMGHEVLTASDLVTALNYFNPTTMMVRSGIEAIITDIFFPNNSKEERYSIADQPCGVAVAIMADKCKVPWVFCTSGYHHGSKYDWICYLSYAYTQWPEMVDSPVNKKGFPTWEDSDESKDWEMALESISLQMEAKRDTA